MAGTNKKKTGPKVTVVKGKNADKNNKFWVIGIIAFFAFIIIVFYVTEIMDSDGGKEKKYLSARIFECPTYTLKEGLDRILGLYSKYYDDFSYELKESKSKSGNLNMYVFLWNEHVLYNDDLYFQVELNDDGKVNIGSYLYSYNTNTTIGNTNNIKALLCNK